MKYVVYAALIRIKNQLRAWQLRIAAAGRHFTTVGNGTSTISATCRLCGRANVHLQVLGAVAATHPGPFHDENYRLVHCGECEVVYLDPLPSSVDLEGLYRKSEQFSDPHYSDNAKVRRILRSYRRRVDFLGLGPKQNEAILEVGAGLAWVSRVCKEYCPNIRTVAQDISSECVSMCPWVDEYVVGPVESLPTGELFSLVSMTHVIEHLTDPRKMMSELSRRLHTHGHIYVTAPFRPALWQLRMGLQPWLEYSYLHVPAHIAYLSKEWFLDCAKECGLELLHWDATHDGHQVFEVVLRKLPSTDADEEIY